MDGENRKKNRQKIKMKYQNIPYYRRVSKVFVISSSLLVVTSEQVYNSITFKLDDQKKKKKKKKIGALIFKILKRTRPKRASEKSYK